MCGIVGYIGTKKACPILLAGLSRLEYRGYDSAGISTIEKDGLSVMKDKGRVKNLSNLDGIDKLEGTTVTDKFDFETKEYTYVYEAPKGGDELPPQTGFDGNISYINYILLIAVVYIIKKYFELISTK